MKSHSRTTVDVLPKSKKSKKALKKLRSCKHYGAVPGITTPS